VPDPKKEGKNFSDRLLGDPDLRTKSLTLTQEAESNWVRLKELTSTTRPNLQQRHLDAFMSRPSDTFDKLNASDRFAENIKSGVEFFNRHAENEKKNGKPLRGGDGGIAELLCLCFCFFFCLGWLCGSSDK
jgi:hypothetical protein